MITETTDIILHWIKTPEDERQKLTNKQDKVYRRMLCLMGLMEKHRLDKDVIDIYLQTQEDKGERISMAQAYRDLDAAKHIQGDLVQIHRKFERASLAKWQKEVMVKAVEISDIRGYNQGMANLIKILGLDREDPIPLDYSKFQPVQPIFGFFPELFEHNELPSDDELLAKVEELRNPAKFRKKGKDAEYIDFTETPGGADQESTS